MRTYTIHNPADVNRVNTRGKNIHTLHFFPSIPARNKEQSKNKGKKAQVLTPSFESRKNIHTAGVEAPQDQARNGQAAGDANFSHSHYQHKGLSCCTQAASSAPCIKTKAQRACGKGEDFSDTPTEFVWFSKYFS